MVALEKSAIVSSLRHRFISVENCLYPSVSEISQRQDGSDVAESVGFQYSQYWDSSPPARGGPDDSPTCSTTAAAQPAVLERNGQWTAVSHDSPQSTHLRALGGGISNAPQHDAASDTGELSFPHTLSLCGWIF